MLVGNKVGIASGVLVGGTSEGDSVSNSTGAATGVSVTGFPVWTTGAGAKVADPQSGLDSGSTTVFQGIVPLLLIVSAPSALGRFFFIFELLLVVMMSSLLSIFPLFLDRTESSTLPPKELAPCLSLFFFLVLLLAVVIIGPSLISCCCFFCFIFFRPISFALFAGSEVLGPFVALRFGGLVSSALGALEASESGRLSLILVFFDFIPLMLLRLALLLLDICPVEIGLLVAVLVGELIGATVELFSIVGVLVSALTGATVELLSMVGAAVIICDFLPLVDFLEALAELVLSFLFCLSSALSIPCTSASEKLSLFFIPFPSFLALMFESSKRNASPRWKMLSDVSPRLGLRVSGASGSI